MVSGQPSLYFLAKGLQGLAILPIHHGKRESRMATEQEAGSKGTGAPSRGGGLPPGDKAPSRSTRRGLCRAVGPGEESNQRESTRRAGP